MSESIDWGSVLSGKTERKTGHLPFDPQDKVSKLIWLKAVFIGNERTGKTSIIKSFCESTFDPKYQPTVGVDYGFKIHHIGRSPVRIHLWDTSGSQEYTDVRNELYDKTHLVAMVYDVTDRDTFLSLESWVTELKQCTEEDGGPALAVVIGNKCDMVNERCVTKEQGENWAMIKGMKHYEISVATSDGVLDTLQESLEMTLDNLAKRKTGT